MPPQPLVDLCGIDLDAQPIFGREQILQVNPQSYEMQQLDGILWYDKENFLVVGYKDVTENEFWIRGHIPGRPLMPGVIMIEAAAQLSSFFVRKIYGIEGFIGFAGIEHAKFRAPVEPGQRLYLVGKITRLKGRRFTCLAQGLIDKDTIAFEASVSGMRV